jgi:hypothetical protein
MATETVTAATGVATEMSLKDQIDAVMQTLEKLDETIAHAVKERKAAASQLSKLVNKLAKEKQPRKAKRDASQPKGETPAQVAAWNQAVNEAHELMKKDGWPAFTTKKGQAFAAAEKRDGNWVFSDTGRAPTYKDAMSFAAHRKGDSAAHASASERSVSPAKARAASPAKAATAAEAKASAPAAGGAGAGASASAARAASPKAKATADAKAEAKAEHKAAAPEPKVKKASK